MNFIQQFADKFYLKQWTFGVTTFDKDMLLKGNWKPDEVKWLDVNNNQHFWADPFLIPINDNWLVFYEDYSAQKQYGTISCCELNKHFEVIRHQPILDTGLHLSYPNHFYQNEQLYVIPESSMQGGLIAYEFDVTKMQIVNSLTLIPQLPLLDSTFLQHEGKYWIFATHRGNNSNKDLFIYHSEKWEGPYLPHEMNPVKSTLFGSRPAGQFFTHQGNIYRPSQNATSHYGQSVIIHKLLELTPNSYQEEFVTEITPSPHSPYNHGIHTINSSNNVIIVDGLRRIFSPITQISIFLRKFFQI